MERVLLFGGTVEGRLLARWCGEAGLPVVLCVATEYGAVLAPEGPGITVRRGRMTGEEMERLMKAEAFSVVVDATHPYAEKVTDLIRGAADRAGLPCLRLVRDGESGGGWRTVPDPAGAAELLSEGTGHILLTTGSKDLDVFARPGLRERCWPRVLPSLESLNRCLELGFSQAQIICMQGPFSQELNEAILRQCGIQTLVTKATGRAGGFWEKVEAARGTGCDLVVIARPVQEEGLDLGGVKEYLRGMQV